MVNEQQAARSREVGGAIQRTVAADPAIAASIVGIGLDALSSTLINSPEQLPGFGGWVELIGGVYAYVMAGERSPRIDALLAGDLAIASNTPA